MKLTPKNKNQLFAIIVMASLGIVSYLFYSFSNEEVPVLVSERQAKEAEISRQRGELRRLQEFAKNIQQIKADFRELNVQLESALEHMPRTYNLPQLLRRLNMVAQNSGVEIQKFKPTKGEEKGDGAFFSTIQFEISLRGTYMQTLVFLDQMSRLKRIISVDSINLAVAKNENLRSGATVADSIALVRTYRFSE
jgi:type IV pilus assembly protein PilO